ncbi:DegV family protein [Pseudoflavonifractor sp. 60]|uniref:DegV family protein n=1 Tax=Pseudoflavonifractor sp. 60 TaxID=2304576 RepID=UPI00136D7AEA|nr:DegV family protein [Pseudoflavonifractor sp. 60]NBI65931.1 DegV family protein [Pseudoflavonifractor sp. 60]
MKFQIVSDSSCDLGREEMARLGVTMVSYYVAFDDEVYYREERDIPTHDFYQMMADRPGVFPKTSMPTPEDYLEAFRPLAAQGAPILCICLNAKFSGSYQTARNAAGELREEYPGAQVRVLDSTLATVLQGMLVEEAAALRDADYSLEEAFQALEALPETGRIFFTTNDLEYLRHGGRIGRAAAATGALLKVKPLIGYKDAGLISDGIAQGRKKSLVKVRELFFRHIQREGIDLRDYRLATGFGLDREEHAVFAQAVYQGLLELGYDRPEVKRPYQIGVTIGVHTGPSPLGVGLLRRAIPA